MKRENLTGWLRKGWISPVVEQWPVLLAWIVLVGWSSLLQNPFYRWFIIFLHAYLVATLVHLTRSRLLKAVAYVVAFVLFVVEATLESCYDLAISPSTLLLAVETNPQETEEFLSTLVQKPAFWLIATLTVVFAAAARWAERHRMQVAARLRRPGSSIAVGLLSALLLVVGLVSSHCYVSLFQCQTTDEVSEWNQRMRHPADALTRVVIALFDTRIANREMSEAISHAQLPQTAVVAPPADTLRVVFVIGESYIRQHSPLYGYPLNTTPFMLGEQASGRLFTFTDAVSPYNLTTHVVRNMLSCNSMADGERWSEKPPLTAVFKACGYRVSMFDNQKDFSLAATFSYALNTYLYHPQIASLCYDETNDQVFEFDGQLIDHFARQPHQTASHELDIFHLMGQHMRFDKRYPTDDARFCRFTADSIRRNEPWMTRGKRADIAHYDNATLYNDHVFQQVTELCQDEQAVVVYVSDHGEEVYDYRDNMGRAGRDDKNNLRAYLTYQYSVPLVVWCSDRYLRQHPEATELLRRAASRPLTTDNLCHMLFHLAGLTASPYYQARHDVLSPDYQCGHRIVNEQYDYDEIVKQKQ